MRTGGWTRWGLVAWVCVASVALAQAPLRKLDQVELRGETDGSWLAITTDRPANFTSFKLNHPTRIVIDFPETTAVPVHRSPSAPSPVAGWTVESLGDAQAPVARLTVELHDDLDYTLTSEGALVQLRLVRAAARPLVALEGQHDAPVRTAIDTHEAEAKAERAAQAKAEAERRAAEAKAAREAQARVEAEAKAAREAQAQAETKRKAAEAQAETERKAAEAKAAREAKAQAEADAKAAREAKAQAEAERKAAEVKAAAERKAQAEAARQQKFAAEREAKQAAASAAEAARQKQLADAQAAREAKAQAERDAKVKAEAARLQRLADVKAERDAKAKAAAAKKAQAEAARRQHEAEAKAAREAKIAAERDAKARQAAARQQHILEARAEREAAAQAAPAKLAALEHVTFHRGEDGSHLMLKLSQATVFSVREESPTRLVIELESAHVPLARNRLPLDTRFFGTSVLRIAPREDRAARRVDVVVDLASSVPYTTRADGASLSVDFRPLPAVLSDTGAER